MQTPQRPLLVAITGNIACGKSLVGRLISEHGIPVIDSDHITHNIYEDDELAKSQIKEYFGTLDRREIAKLVFNNSDAKGFLERLLHPLIEKKLYDWVASHTDQAIVCHLIPLLFEAKLEKRYNKIILVKTNENLQLKRLIERNPELSKDEILSRIRSQMPQAEKEAKSDYIIDNSADIAHTSRQLELILSELTR